MLSDLMKVTCFSKISVNLYQNNGITFYKAVFFLAIAVRNFTSLII